MPDIQILALFNLKKCYIFMNTRFVLANKNMGYDNVPPDPLLTAFCNGIRLTDDHIIYQTQFLLQGNIAYSLIIESFHYNFQLHIQFIYSGNAEAESIRNVCYYRRNVPVQVYILSESNYSNRKGYTALSNIII